MTKFKLGDKVKVKDCEYGVSSKTVEKEGVIDNNDSIEFDYRVDFGNGKGDLYFEYELEHANSEIEIEVKKAHPYISYNPTFNLEELPLGSLIYIDKGYLQLQGILTKVSLAELTIAYYDYESISNLSRETVDIKYVLSGQQSFEIIREAIPLHRD